MVLVKRLLMLVLVILAPVALVEAVNLDQLRAERETQIRRNAMTRIEVIGQQERQFVEGLDGVLAALSVGAEQAAASPQTCTLTVRSLAASSANWLQIAILDQAGIVRCAADPTMLGLDLSGHPEIADALRGDGLHIGQFELGIFDDEPTLQVAMRWRGTDGRFGVVCARVRLGRFAADIAETPMPRRTAVLIADRAGNYVTAAGRASSRLPDDFLALMQQTAGGTRLMRWLDGTDRTVGFAPPDSLPLRGAFVAVGVDRQTALAGIRAAEFRSVALIAATIVAAGLLTVWAGGRYISRPIRALTAAAQRWRDGDGSARVRLPGRSELSALGRSFDEMADAIEDAQRRLRSQAALLEAVLESSPDAIFVKDREGRLIFANSAKARQHGVGRAALVGGRDSELAPEESRDAILAAEARLLATGAPVTFDATAWWERGAGRRDLQMVYAPLADAAGEITAMACIGRDLTELRAASAAMRRARDAAEAADRSKSRFLAAASHDLRQPLQAAILFAQQASELAEGGAGDRAEAAVDTLGRLDRVLEDMKRLLDSLFDISGLDAGVIEPAIEAFPLQSLLERVGEWASDTAKRKALRLAVTPCGAIVRSDPTLLARMLRNLVENAVRYTEAGRVAIETTISANAAIIEVADTGPGIAAADLSRIWDEFEQLHNPERNRMQGIGLGLSIVRRLGRLLGHKVDVSSQPGRGSRFTIEVPLAARQEPAPRKPSASSHAASARGRLVLVVDDDLDILSGLEFVLSGRGYQVATAGDGREALSAIGRLGRAPDLLVVDYRLRDDEVGADVVDRIRTVCGRGIPGVFLTGEIGQRPKLDAERQGLGLVLKPVTAERLLLELDRQWSARDETAIARAIL